MVKKMSQRMTGQTLGNIGMSVFIFVSLLFLSSHAAGSTNVAPFYTSVTASSQYTAYGQLASKAVDGVVDGYPGDYTKEWATVGGKAGSWIRLDWSSAYTVDHVTLYDRPNLNDQVMSGTLLFSDGTSVPVGTLPNNGAALTVSFTSRSVTWVKFTVNSVSATTQNVGLAEIQVYGSSTGGGGNAPPVISSGPTASPSNITENETAQLSVTASDPDGDTLTYTWQPASGTISGSGATVTFHPPAVSADTVVHINLTVSDPGGLSATGYVDVVIRDLVQSKDSIMVIAAHPDDETLMGAGVIKRSLDRGDSVKVVVVTNGDYNGNGLGREAESKAALADRLGLNVNDIIFLGYPDKGLQSLYNDYPTTTDGSYTSHAGMTATYGAEGLGGYDFHSYKTGVAGNYNWATLMSDLQDILGRYRPSQIYTHSPADQHPDHRMTFTAVRDAVVSLMKSDPLFRPDEYITTIHNPVDYPFVDKWVKSTGTPQTQDGGAGDAGWPNPAFTGTLGNVTDMRKRFTPTLAFVELPHLYKTPYAWVDRLSLAVPAVMQDTNLANNLKYQMIDGYVSQRHTVGLIYAFGKNEEIFWKQGWARNIAMTATFTASSQSTASFQQATNVADGIPDGSPGNSQAEWVTLSEKANAWVKMAWPQSHTVNQIILYDRPNTNDQILSGTLTFSDGTNVVVAPTGGLPNSGQPYTVNLSPAKTITSVRFTVNTVSGTTTSTGLAEMQVMEVQAPVANHRPFFTRGPWAGVYTLAPSAITIISAPAYDADGDPLTYTWQSQLGASITGSGSTVTYQAPSSPAKDTITVTVTDGVNLPVSASFVITTSTVSNVAPLYSSVTASSQYTAYGQLASKAVDGVADGYPGDYTKEWATVGGKAGSWIRLDWSSAYTVDHVTLYDRPNLNDQVMSGTLLFSDGTSVPVGTLPNNGAALTVTFTPRSVTWVKFTVNSVSATTQNVGLAEMQVYGSSTGGGGNASPVISAGPTASPSNITENETAQLSVSASDPDGDSLTYTWQPASGTISGSGSTVTFNPPAVSADTVVRINLTVSDPGGLSATGYVNVTVRNVTGGTAVNVAPLYSSVTASSQYTAYGQLASKAVDGVVDGYPGDYTKEWATVGGKAGSWIRLDWSSAYTVDHVTLYDRPNLNDQVMSGTLLFSDGTSVSVGTLPNNGAALTVSFTPRSVTWVKFTVNSVSATTQNVGLAEIQIFASPSDQTILYQENFNSVSATGWSVVDSSAATHAPSIWSVVNGQYQESSGTRYSDDVGIFGQTADGYELTATYSRYDGGSYGPMDLRLQVRSTDIGVVGVLFGYQNNNNYYRLALSKRAGYRRLEKKVNGVFTPLAESTQSFTVGQWISLRVVMGNGVIVIFMDGKQVLAATDTSFSAGKIALWDSRNGPCQFDDITVLTLPAQPVIGLTAPAEYAVGGGTLNVEAELTDDTTNVGGVEFVLDEGAGGAQTQTDPSYPYTAQFNFAAAGTHEVRAYALDGSSQRISGVGSVDVNPGIGVNGYYLVGFGDSITDGVLDDVATDDISLDGRNTSGGYEPVLNNLLTAYYSKPVTVVDEGYPENTTPQGWAKIATSLNRTQGSQTYLVMFGTNDALQSLAEPPGLDCYPGQSCYIGSYKEAMQGIIDAVISTSQDAYLAKVPPIIGNSTLNTVIQQFNRVLDQLVTDNAWTGLVYAGPDFYTYFTNNPGKMGPDHIHPNGAGYAAMGQLWRNSLAGNL